MSTRMEGARIEGLSGIYLSMQFMKLLSIVGPLQMCGCSEKENAQDLRNRGRFAGRR